MKHVRADLTSCLNLLLPQLCLPRLGKDGEREELSILTAERSQRGWSKTVFFTVGHSSQDTLKIPIGTKDMPEFLFDSLSHPFKMTGLEVDSMRTVLLQSTCV